LNGLNGVYGIGAIAAPILVSITGARYGLIYTGGAAVAAVALFGFRGVSGSLRGASSNGTAPSSRRTVRLVVIFAIAFGLYVGVEIGVAGWMPTHLHSAGYGLAATAALTSGFWLALATGRFLVGPLTLRVSESAIVLGGTAVAVLCLAGALIAPFAPVAYIATGLAIAPVFPTGVAWLAALRPANPGATSWLFPASMVGGALIPSAIGLVIARVGAGWVPAILAAVAIGTLAAFTAAAHSSTRLN
jgi:fucose permease